MTTGTLSIQSEHIMPIIKKWLYSEKDIFVRELVSNACDAIQKVKILRDRNEAKALDEEFRIDITIDKENNTLRFSDTGLGMDAEEVRKYIAEIAFSGAEDFIKHYTSEDEKDQFIGHFGLGFYSAYMVADKVEINSLSYKEDAEAVKWTCDGSAEYTTDVGSRESRGTDITLHISEEGKDFLEEAELKKILTSYCSYLPFPIYLGEERINDKEPLWMKSPSDCTDEEYLEFYRQLHPMEADPLFWVHLNVDFPFHLKGILFFPKLSREHDFNKNHISLFCNRVFVSNNCKDLIPDYLTSLRGVIDSPDIPLNVSRSYLQMDNTVRQLSTHIAKKVADRLTSLLKTDRENFLKCWEDIDVIIKLGAMQDDKFYSRVKEAILWKNSDADWMTVEEYIELNKDKHKDKVFYSLEDKHNTNVLNLYKEKGIQVLHTHTNLDLHLFSFLEGKHAPARFQRIDSQIDDSLLDASKEKTILNEDGKSEASLIADFVKTSLGLENLEVEAKSLSGDSIPGFVMLDENMRRMRDTMLASGRDMAMDQWDSMTKRTFIINTNNSLVTTLQSLQNSNPELAKDLVRHVYDSALLSQKELNPDALNEFLARSNRVMESLAKEASK